MVLVEENNAAMQLGTSSVRNVAVQETDVVKTFFLRLLLLHIFPPFKCLSHISSHQADLNEE